MSIEYRNISPSQISIYIDGSDRTFIEDIISNSTVNAYEIGTSDDFLANLKDLEYVENLILFVTGHGNIEGLHAKTPIRPHDLLSTIKNIPKILNAVIYLGQCYAGIFNYMPVGRKECPDTGEILEPTIVVVGATNLYSSISASTEETFLSGSKRCSANLFLLHLFNWIKSPIDVDGDSRLTVMDSYKYAGSYSNDSNKKVKSINYYSPLQVLEKLIPLEKQLSTMTGSEPNYINLTLDYRALKLQYDQILDIQFNHQEPWVLNSIPAQEIEF